MVNILSAWRFGEDTYTDTTGHRSVPERSSRESVRGDGSTPARRATRYGPKHVLFYEGDEADTVYEVIDGTVMLYTISENGRRTVIGFLQKGDYFGFVLSDFHAYFAQTIGTCVIRSIPRAKLWRQIREHHRAAEKFLSLEGNALAKAQQHMILLTRKTPIERVSMFLLEMAARQGADGTHSAKVHLPMTRADIADYLGLVVETVCRCLTHLKDDGVIGTETRGQVDVLNAAALDRYALGETGSHFGDKALIPERIDMSNASVEVLTDAANGSLSYLVAY